MNTTGKKFGGRKKGTPNKITKELKETLQDVINVEIQELPARLNELETKDRLSLLAKLLPYVLPKESEQMSFDIKNPEPIKFEIITLKDID